MLAIGKTLVSKDIIEKKFVCDLNRCKGACCVAGDAGAPLEKSELRKLKNSFEKIKPCLSEAGKAAIEKKGLYITEKDGQFLTPLVDKSLECAYAYFEKGIAKCAIEKAFMENMITFRKPLSCHLYPVRITNYPGYDALNYDKWDVCSPACELGQQLQVPVFKFVKDALIRKYGQGWYSALEAASNHLTAKQF
jgi:hypothetical protein